MLLLRPVEKPAFLFETAVVGLLSAYSIADFSAELRAARIPYFAHVDSTPQHRFAKGSVICDLVKLLPPRKRNAECVGFEP